MNIYNEFPSALADYWCAVRDNNIELIGDTRTIAINQLYMLAEQCEKDFEWVIEDANLTVKDILLIMHGEWLKVQGIHSKYNLLALLMFGCYPHSSKSFNQEYPLLFTHMFTASLLKAFPNHKIVECEVRDVSEKFDFSEVRWMI